MAKAAGASTAAKVAVGYSNELAPNFVSDDDWHSGQQKKASKIKLDVVLRKSKSLGFSVVDSKFGETNVAKKSFSGTTPRI